MAFSMPQRKPGMALVIAAADFPNTPAVLAAAIFPVLLTFTGLVVQFALHPL